MTKKKCQEGPNAVGSDSSSEDFENPGPQCSHIAKAVDLNRVKKVILKSNTLSSECEQCKKSPSSHSDDSLYISDDSLWICLKCGNQACGRYKNQHALHHYKTPHSDCHSICLNTSNWNVWCYDCDDDINVTPNRKKLFECVEYIKKHFEELYRKQQNQQQNVVVVPQESIFVYEATNVPVIVQKPERPQIVACGLMNLGNTCFFNSVIQCLGQTPYLLSLLQETAEPGQTFCLPGGKVLLDEKTKQFVEVESIEGTLDGWRPLPKLLADTLQTLQSGTCSVYNPRPLFNRLTQRMTQFGGGDQHDSHELLRHLLEAVREEDLRRYQSVILVKRGLSGKTDPAQVEGDKKKIIKFYGSQASDLMSPTEQVFRGVLVSLLQCQDCGHKSHREENFLDLSLPICERQMPPILRRKAEEIEDQQPSKHQLKKERRLAKKNKRNKTHNRSEASVSNAEETQRSPDNSKNSESESDADVEDNNDDSNSMTPPEEGASNNKGTESGYNSDKNGASPDNFTSPNMCVDDSGMPSPVVGMPSLSPPESTTMSSSPVPSPGDSNMGSPLLCGPTTPNEEDFERPQSRLSFVNNNNEAGNNNNAGKNDLKAGLEKLTLDNRLLHVNNDINDEDDDDDSSKMDVDVDLWSETISARYNIEDGECSVQSCLNQFTTKELMTGTNKVGCELCTKRSSGTDKKTVYTNATKQLLIYSPPAVLILHLKRFQVYHFRPSKMGKHVKFPMLLDIAPFCLNRSPNVRADQKKVLYSLYGVVEHSGSMHGGHYVAYIKIRPKIESDNYRWQFLPKNQKSHAEKLVQQASNALPNSDKLVSDGRWFYVSDSHTSEVSEEKVLNAYAYLLFYERVL